MSSLKESIVQVQISKEGRRYYLLGNTYAIKDALRAAGAKWDRERGAWWTSKPDVAARFEEQVREKSAALEAVQAATANEPRSAVRGNTYPVREALRALGGTWDAAGKVWVVPASKEAEANALVAAAPKSTFKRPSPDGYYRRGGQTLARGCADCSRLGRMCAQCEFDS